MNHVVLDFYLPGKLTDNELRTRVTGYNIPISSINFDSVPTRRREYREKL